jgi:hypothetical protein
MNADARVVFDSFGLGFHRRAVATIGLERVACRTAEAGAEQ